VPRKKGNKRRDLFLKKPLKPTGKIGKFLSRNQNQFGCRELLLKLLQTANGFFFALPQWRKFSFPYAERTPIPISLSPLGTAHFP
jgi:hypothetical protein